MAADEGNVNPRPPGIPPTQPPGQASDLGIEFIRRAYASTREWYTLAETKAQLLLTVNGVFVTVLFGLVFGKNGDTRSVAGHLGIDTLTFLCLFASALLCAIVCAVLSLWSLHGKADEEFARLGVDPENPASYRPEVLWYFGHLARLRTDAAIELLRRADQNFEIETLSYNLVDTARKVLRKHRWVNAGWAFTGLALIALMAAGISFFVRS